MQLTPCAQCHRHVAITETTCPFCGEAREPTPPRPSTFGRMSRAAVFAGAALATTACGKKAKQPGPNTSTTTQQQQEQTPPDASPDAPTSEPVKVVPHPEPMPYGAPPARRRYV
jgi:hypothetical protein